MAPPNRVFNAGVQDTLTSTLFSQQRSSCIFTGKTANTTQTELFIEGVTNQRLIPPPDCVLIGNWYGIGSSEVGSVDPAHYIGKGEFSVRRTAGGNLVAAGTNADPVAADGNPGGRAILGTEGDCVFDLNGTVLRLRVTGPAGDCYWLVRVDLLCLAYPPVDNLLYGDR